MFLVRPKPLLGESLSSWRQRAALANGFTLFPRAPGELVRSDSDLKPGPSAVAWLAENHGIPPQDVARMTLASLDGVLLRFRGGASVPRWVLPLRYTRRDRPFGIPFCPLCLREDAEPYFRLRWRLGLSSSCSSHGVRLVDACSRCGHPPWPATNALRNLYEGSWIPLHECPVCRFDLRHCTAEEDRHESLPVGGLFLEDDVTLSTGEVVDAADFAAAAWCVAQLFVRNRSARKIHSAAPEVREVIEQASQCGERAIEWLPIGLRHRLTSKVAGLFRRWPESLLTFSERCGLSAEHFSVDRQELPLWFEAAIRIPLRRQIRDVTIFEVRQAISEVASSGRSLTKQAVADVLGCSGGKSLDEALGRRMRASSDELLLMLAAMDIIVGADQRRKSSTEVLVRDAVGILMAIALNRELELVVEMSLKEALEAMEKWRNRASTGDVLDGVYDRLLGLSETYLQHRMSLGRKRDPAADVFFVCFRGGRVQARSVQKLLRDCMSRLDSRLYRSVTVFFPSIDLENILFHQPAAAGTVDTTANELQRGE